MIRVQVQEPLSEKLTTPMDQLHQFIPLEMPSEKLVLSQHHHPNQILTLQMVVSMDILLQLPILEMVLT